jgi:sugar-specific transcriptional regulator TrmB
VRIAWPEFALLEEAGLGSYEKRALVTLVVHGVTDAATLCRDGDIPTSKIYAAMEKLADLGLVELRRSRPKLYAALPIEPLVQQLDRIVAGRAEQFRRDSARLARAFEGLPRRLRGGQPRVDLALGVESHVKRHLTRLASARRGIVSYMEAGDLDAITRVAADGFDLMRTIARQREKSPLEHRVVFGFTQRSAPRLLSFLADNAAATRTLSGVRYSGEIGHPFHVIDGAIVILAFDHPFVGEGRFASLLVEDEALAQQLQEGFDGLWRKALANLREIRQWPSAAPGA